MLSGYRVLDLTDEKGLLCGKMLADMGAEVIKIEPPGGDLSRNLGPFVKDIPNRERSLYWFAYNLGKKSITLDIETADGKAIFKDLVKTADFVIESFSPGYLKSIGLSYDDLSVVNPKIILTSITPFGQDGPYQDYKAPDIVVMAMGGGMYLGGEPDREPLNFSFPIAYLHAASEATVGTLIANYHRGVTGEGQHVDQSAQESVLGTMHNVLETWDLTKKNIKRTGNVFALRPAPFIGTKILFKCKDGYVNYVVNTGQMGAKNNPILIEWMKSDGIDVDEIKDIKWAELDMLDFSKEKRSRMVEIIQQFFLRHTKKELYDESTKRRLLLYPVSTIEDLAHDPQLEFRNFWEKVDQPDLDTTITYPHQCALVTGFNAKITSPPPRIGEHNIPIFSSIGISSDQLNALQEKGVI